MPTALSLWQRPGDPKGLVRGLSGDRLGRSPPPSSRWPMATDSLFRQSLPTIQVRVPIIGAASRERHGSIIASLKNRDRPAPVRTLAMKVWLAKAGFIVDFASLRYYHPGVPPRAPTMDLAQGN